MKEKKREQSREIKMMIEYEGHGGCGGVIDVWPAARVCSWEGG